MSRFELLNLKAIMILSLSFYFFSFIVSTLPLVFELFLRREPKPRWYKLLIVVSAALTLILGVFKVSSDEKTSNTLNLLDGKLSKNEINYRQLSKNFNDYKVREKTFEDSLKSIFGIIRNQNNQPQKVQINKIFNNKMRDVNNLIEQ